MGCSHAKPRPVAPELAARRRFAGLGSLAEGVLGHQPEGRLATVTRFYSRATLVFIRLAHDRWFVVVFLFFFVVLVVFIRISGRHSVADDQDGTSVDQTGAKLFEESNRCA
jgi:hypothetical protein